MELWDELAYIYPWLYSSANLVGFAWKYVSFKRKRPEKVKFSVQYLPLSVYFNLYETSVLCKLLFLNGFTDQPVVTFWVYRAARSVNNDGGGTGTGILSRSRYYHQQHI